MILKAHTVGPLAVRAYVVGCPESREALVVDPAGSEEMLAREITDLGLRLRWIVNTHGHPDHTCGNLRMKELTGAPVLMHPDDDRLFRTPEAAAMFRAWGFEPAPPADDHIEDGQVLRLGTLSFEVLHTPGHSPGSICLYGEGYVLTGDTLFVGAMGRTDLPGGSYATLMHSLQTRVLTLPEETVVLPGHDYGPQPTSTVGREKRTNPFLREGL
ncbi:MBL fold metallo-hydrolase [Dissulfurirhabdus thermomarina]|uniref:MBL fold metallo-hydrolase n=1 Tax=Dissulfurirhabdus thermomarina TaxID=1765737 RepID=A0A6N9TLH6_DISTH|nr:MBL fold metallo-hydrolase [Dissulfurirhabdus thermomarina]NDY42132.1 MBL fold metallo-hydrolase [Dissulfurirhabdus thermomarina]NMX23142.1 MBL fold metallo-hydrolase [Dissulfurirhabdus thermomarina]